ncbi:MAG TPA: hypothetical protein VNH40_07950 [Gaiellaceae bacterium]|nr:hypothetical protein [Gaiellaceae bacterium]
MQEFGEYEWGAEYEEEQEWGSEAYELAELPITEMQEAELASELLEVGSEYELEQFLGKLFKSVARGVGGFIKSPVGRALGGVLKSVAKKALPVVGGALGSMVAPGIGTAIGSKLGSMAGGLFELELEGLSPQEAEFEVAKRFVRLASLAARNAALAPKTLPTRVVAHKALLDSARLTAPGLYRQLGRYGYIDTPYGAGGQTTGRWIRRGNKVVIYGI